MIERMRTHTYTCMCMYVRMRICTYVGRTPPSPRGARPRCPGRPHAHAAHMYLMHAHTHGTCMCMITAWQAAADERGSVPAHVHDVYTSVVRQPQGFRDQGRPAQTIVLLTILADDVNHGYDNLGWRMLTSLNGQPVSNLSGLYAAWRAIAASSGQPSGTTASQPLGQSAASGTTQGGTQDGAASATSSSLVFSFADRRHSIVLSTRECEESESRILAAHGIPARTSQSFLSRADHGADRMNSLARGVKKRNLWQGRPPRLHD